MSDDDLIAEAAVLVDRVRLARKKAPITRSDFAALAAAVEAVAQRAAQPDTIRELTAQALMWLEPGGEHEDLTY